MKVQSYLSLTAIGFGLLGLSGCSRRGPAFPANANGYMAKPIYRGEDAGAWYFSGRMNRGYEYVGEEKNRGGDGAAHFSYTTKYWYISAGGYGYWGKYSTKPVIIGPSSVVQPGGKYNFYGAGVRGDLGGRIPIPKHCDLLVGISGEFFRENRSFRRTNEFGEGTFIQEVAGATLNLAPALDFRFMFDSTSLIGLRYSFDTYYGVTQGDGVNFYLQRLTLHTTLNRITLFGQLGFARNNQKVYSLGMSYGIPTKNNFLKKHL